MCTTKVNGNDFVNDMNGGLFISLIGILNENDNWENLIQVIPPEIYKANDVQKFRSSPQSPARALLNDLGDRITVEELVSYLENLQLAKALLLFKCHEPVTVTMSPPEQTEVTSGRRSHLKLQCKAQGFPYPAFHWFRKPNDQDILEELLLQRQPTLDISPIRKQDEGAYICKVSNQNPENEEESTAWTQWCIVTVKETSSDEDNELPDVPIIMEHPRSPNCCVDKRSNVVLRCLAKSYYPLSYEWYRNGVTLENENCHEIKLNNLTPQDSENQWTFQCRVYNKCGSVLSQPALVKLGNVISNVAFVEDKVALLIANQSYTNLNPLRLPGEDARSLAIRLQNLGFKVITLLDLTKEEMEKALDDFCKLLDTGVIGLFYYVGHGFEINRTCYLLPVDATSEFLRSGSLSSEDVLSKMQAHDTALCLIMLDTCRLEPQMNMAICMEPSPLFRSMVRPRVRRNLVYAYSTSYSCAAYESKTGRNGVFVKYLKKYISQDIPIQDVFFHVANDVATDPIASKKQYPWLETNLASRCSLATKIQQTLPSSAARNFFYSSIMALPKMIPFKIGTSETGDLTFQKYKDVFCNALSVTAKWKGGTKMAALSLSPFNAGITITALKGNSDQDKTYVIQGLQKLQEQLQIKFTINCHSCALKLGYPLIAQANRQDCAEVGGKDIK